MTGATSPTLPGMSVFHDDTRPGAPAFRRGIDVAARSAGVDGGLRLLLRVFDGSLRVFNGSRRAFVGSLRGFGGSLRIIQLRSAPAARSDLTRRSTLTVGSPASIFATRDWLEPTLFASSA